MGPSGPIRPASAWRTPSRAQGRAADRAGRLA